MEIVGARRVHFDPIQERLIGQAFGKNGLRSGTAADVAHADKQDFEIGFIHIDVVSWLLLAQTNNLMIYFLGLLSDAARQHHGSGNKPSGPPKAWM